MKIYVASSWRNDYQPHVVNELRNAGHEVYDFKNPPSRAGFRWEQINSNWQSWSLQEYKEALIHPLAESCFKSDKDAMIWAEIGVLVLPSNRSAHTEAGWMCGIGMPVYVVSPISFEPELMYKLFSRIFLCVEDLIKHLNK